MQLKDLDNLNFSEPRVTRNPYIEPGNLVGEILNVQGINTKDKGDAYIVDFKIIQSDNTANPPGSVAAWFQALRNTYIANKRMPEFIVACMGYDWTLDREEIETKLIPNMKAFIEKSMDPAQPLKGKKVRIKASLDKNKAGDDYTKIEFFPSLSVVNS